MKLIIAGSRDIFDYNALVDFFESIKFPSKIDEIVSGCAAGVDALGEKLAKDKGIYLNPDEPFKAKWKEYGAAAGGIRNHAMAEYADALLLLWDGRSPGSKNMKRQMEAEGKPIYEMIYGRKKNAREDF